MILGALEEETKSPETFFDLSDFGRRNPSVHLIEDFVSKFIDMKNFKSSRAKISETTWWNRMIFGALEEETKSPETFFDLSDFGRRNPSVHLIKVRRFSKKSKDWLLSSKIL